MPKNEQQGDIAKSLLLATRTGGRAQLFLGADFFATESSIGHWRPRLTQGSYDVLAGIQELGVEVIVIDERPLSYLRNLFPESVDIYASEGRETRVNGVVTVNEENQLVEAQMDEVEEFAKKLFEKAGFEVVEDSTTDIAKIEQHRSAGSVYFLVDRRRSGIRLPVVYEDFRDHFAFLERNGYRIKPPVEVGEGGMCEAWEIRSPYRTKEEAESKLDLLDDVIDHGGTALYAISVPDELKAARYVMDLEGYVVRSFVRKPNFATINTLEKGPTATVSNSSEALRWFGSLGSELKRSVKPRPSLSNVASSFLS